MLTVTIAGQDVTLIADEYQFSNVARGGFEQAQFQLSFDHLVERGDEVIIFDGADIAWHGFINSPGKLATNGKRRTGIVALGYGAKLKGETTMMIFLDTDFNSWTAPGVSRQINILNANRNSQPASTAVDFSTGLPAMKLSVTGAWASPVIPQCESCYRAPNGLNIESVFWAFSAPISPVSAADPNWFWQIASSIDDTFNSLGTIQSGNLLSASAQSALALSTDPENTHALLIQFRYNATSAGTNGQEYVIYATKLIVGGDHGLTKRFLNPTSLGWGLLPEDVAEWGITHAPLKCTTYIEKTGSYIIRDLKYLTPVEYEKIIADAATFLGWMWGTWEPATMFNTMPQFRFEAPPVQATCEVSLSDCDDVDEPVASLDNCYNRAVVNYQDAAGGQHSVTVTRENPVLDALGATRDLPLTMGIADSDAATTYGAFALSLSQSSQRGGGSVSIAGDVMLSSGGTKPATLLRSGRDRLRIPELNDGDLFRQDDRSLDAFLVERVETTVTGGKVTTRVEFDSGADLMEVINARMTSELTAANVNR